MTPNIRQGIISFIIFISLSSFSNAQDSLINSMLNIQQSIVHITAVQTRLSSSPQSSAVIDPSIKKITLAQNIRKTDYIQKSSGVIISPDGFIITNLHAVRGANKVIITFYNGFSFPAEILYLSAPYDLALLKIKTPNPVPAIEFEDSNIVKLGDEVINIGSSDILNNTISSGIISGLGTRNEGNHRNIELIKIRMNIYQGDSGGPVLTRQGKLIGIMAAKLSKQDRASIAIPSNKIKKLYLEFFKKGYNIQKYELPRQKTK